MSTESPKLAPRWRAPLLCVIAMLIVLAMLRLGVWQLDRAEQKGSIVAQLANRTNGAITPLQELVTDQSLNDLRFRKVSLKGRYLADKDILIDNQVVNGQVGYQVFTPFELSAGEFESELKPNLVGNPIVLVARGWVSVGSSRDVVPTVSSSRAELSLEGRLNNPPAKPPLWNDKYPVSNGVVWQFLPILDLAEVLKAQVFPLVVELAPTSSDSPNLVRKWPEISDQGVAKHKAYALQWFAMALAFFIACLVLLVNSVRRK